MSKSVEARLREALAGFGDPVENGVYLGKKDRYYTIHTSTMPDLFANDAPGVERYLIQVHLFAPLDFNFVTRRRQTETALFNAGFGWPDCTDASDSNGRHLVFECECAEGVEPDGNDGD